MKSVLVGLAAFVGASLFTAMVVVMYHQYKAVEVANKLLMGQCSVVEQDVIDKAVAKALAEDAAKRAAQEAPAQ